ncbi:MAG: alpha-ketoacid dehydrogenase subunit beta [Candidatus Aenigmarchaeota archaeon]|nr:alpha-ketoacid dehydrogenase subunit beta [Candidatus Aenigmarchaeota archaeon]MDI6722024.1 alpha-ketoacid dehydrogenase subunit beta [Candidatus Aenigmarchaeota archaeon]
MTLMNMVQAINLALRQEMEKDKTVVVMGEDVGVNGGVFRVTEGLYEKFPDRVIDTPLAESAIVGTSIGLALNGLKPVAEIQFEGFLYPALDQLISHAGRIRTRTRGRFNVPLTLRVPYTGGIHAPEHHSESPEALLVHVPGIKVVTPSNPYDAKGLLVSAIRDPDPVVYFEPKRVYRSIKMEVPEDEYTIPIGKSKIVAEGEDVTVVSWGAMMKQCSEAIKNVKHSCELVDVRTLSPLDAETIAKSVEKTGRAVIVHEAWRSCGVGAEISSQIMEKVFLSLEAPVERVTGLDVPVPLAKLENYFIPSVDKIISTINKVAVF